MIWDSCFGCASREPVLPEIPYLFERADGPLIYHDIAGYALHEYHLAP
jgi:hypothetical protein